MRGTSRCAPGAFSLTAPVFRSSRAQKGAWCARAWCARRVNYFQASSAPTTPTTSPATKATHQPHHQRQKPRANQASNPGNTTHQPVSTAATAAPAPEATYQPHHQHQKPRANQTSSPGNITHRPASTTATASATARSHTPTTSPTPETTRPLHQRFLYCDGETPNISLKYFVKYFCVPKPTASETSTTLSPASADNS